MTTDKPLGAYLHTSVFADGSAFGALQAQVQSLIGPFFRSAIQQKQSRDKKTVDGVTHALEEMDTLLKHLQQDTDIPQVVLSIDPVIVKAVAAVG
jgi:hypothetical protein